MLLLSIYALSSPLLQVVFRERHLKRPLKHGLFDEKWNGFSISLLCSPTQCRLSAVITVINIVCVHSFPKKKKKKKKPSNPGDVEQTSPQAAFSISVKRGL
jgi:hypothetical protein